MNDCITCPMKSKDTIDINLYKLNKVIKYIKNIYNKKNSVAVVSGGEPLLHPNFIDIIGTLSKVFDKIIVQTHLITHSTSNTKKILKELVNTTVNNNITLYIQVSIYGHDKESYYQWTRRLWFDKFNETLIKLIHYCVNMGGSCFIELRSVISNFLRNINEKKMMNYIIKILSITGAKNVINSIRFVRFNCLDKNKIYLKPQKEEEIELLLSMLDFYISLTNSIGILSPPQLRISSFSINEDKFLDQIISEIRNKYNAIVEVVPYKGIIYYVGPYGNIRDPIEYEERYLRITI